MTGAASEAALLAEAERATGDPRVLFLPYLSGERTPHNDPARDGRVRRPHARDHARRSGARGARRRRLRVRRRPGRAARRPAPRIGDVSVIGGGARSRFWGRILASALDRPLRYHAGGESGPAFGAARLARLAVTGEDPLAVCTPPPVEHVVEPDAELRDRYARATASLPRNCAS